MDRRQRFVGAVIAVALMVVMFAVGGIVYATGTGEPGRRTTHEDRGSDARGENPHNPTQMRFESWKARSTRAVAAPSDEDAPQGTEAQRRDVTAVPAVVYANIPEEELEDRSDVAFAPADPTELTRPLWQRPPPRPVTSTEDGISPANSLARLTTPPVPLAKPLPSFDRLPQEGTVRVVVGVSADGSVRNVTTQPEIPGVTDRLRNAVSEWRFRPATKNGEPVEGTYKLDIHLSRR